MDWLVEFLDIHEDVTREETYVGLSASALSRALAHRFDHETELADVAGWHVHVISVDD